MADDPSVRAGLPRILASPGVEVTTVGSLEEAEAMLDELEFDLVLCDLCRRGLEDRDGLDLVAWVHEHHPETAVLLLTALGSTELHAEAMTRGASDCWEKQRPIQELIGKVRSLVGSTPD